MRIVATIGPSISEKLLLKELITCGVSTFRFNFSHGSIEEFDEKFKLLKELKEDIHIMVDLPGSKIRISDKLPYIYKIYNGEEVIFCGENVYKNEGYSIKKGRKRLIPLNIKDEILREKHTGKISMKDDTMRFDILHLDDRGLHAKVRQGGIVRAGKGCNIKGFPREDIEISAKDKIAINWAIKNKADIICQSFVESIADVKKLKNIIGKEKYSPTIWAKVETPKGIENIKAISKEVDGILIGRGDLVAEGSIIDTPIYQHKVFEDLKDYDGEIIIGTHILNSMKQGRKAELSEVESIYNLILKGASGFLLSGETSIGKAPIKTVKFLEKLIERYN